MITHDRLFKYLIETFFEEFMLLFLPEAAEAIDFSQVTFLQQEIFPDLIKGEKKIIDLLVETKLHNEESMILIHVEPQAYFLENFYERMFVYHNRLFEKYRMRILPVAIFSYEEKRDEDDHFLLQFPFMEVSRFQFVTIELNKEPWRKYVRQDNPIAAALLSKMGYTKEERVQVKKEFLRMLVRLQLDPARMQVITGFFETYLKLTPEEDRTLMEEIQMLNPKEEGDVMELVTSWEKKGREEGLEEGVEKGREEEKIEVAKKMLSKGLDEDLILEVTGLTKEELAKLKDDAQ